MDFSVIILLSSVYFVHGFAAKRCLLYKGECVNNCPQQMHPYHTKCDGQTLSQLTCNDPKQYVLGYTCGWSRCDCNGHLFFDEATGACVEEEFCSRPFRRRRFKENADIRRKSIRVRARDKFDIAEDALDDD